MGRGAEKGSLGVERHLEERSGGAPRSVGDDSMACRKGAQKASWLISGVRGHHGGAAYGEMSRRRPALMIGAVEEADRLGRGTALAASCRVRAPGTIPGPSDDGDAIAVAEAKAHRHREARLRILRGKGAADGTKVGHLRKSALRLTSSESSRLEGDSTSHPEASGWVGR